MMNKVFLTLISLLLLTSSVFADDVSIDSDGNVETGVSSSANLEVTGASGEDAILGSASGTGAAGVYGVNTTYDNYGILGYDSYGVYGNSPDWAGWFQGDVRVTGNLTVDGAFTGNETDPQVGSLVNNNWCTSDGSQVNCSQSPPILTETDPVFIGSPSSGITTGLISNWNTAYGWGDHSIAGYDRTGDSWTGTTTVSTIWSVGIGTVAPTSKLTVVGTIESTNGGFKFPDGSIQTTAVSTSTDQNPHSNSISTLDTLDNNGTGTSIVIGADGLPVIAYVDYFDNRLMTAKCGNISCSSGNTITPVIGTMPGGGETADTSIIIGTDGMPVIAYDDEEGIRIVKCGDAMCSSGNVVANVGYGAASGSGVSLTLGTDGFPIVAYRESSYLQVAKCNTASCLDVKGDPDVTITDIASDIELNSNPALVMDIDGLPIISYYNASGELRVVKCDNASCSFSPGNTSIYIDTDQVNTDVNSITIGADGRPIVLYNRSPEGLSIYRCDNISCSPPAGAYITLLTGRYASSASITIGTDGFPVFALEDLTDLRLLKCLDTACTSAPIFVTIDSTGNVGAENSITTGIDGLPVISYYDATNTALKAAKCANSFCINNWIRR
jgi:hypothetical protein